MTARAEGLRSAGRNMRPPRGRTWCRARDLQPRRASSLRLRNIAPPASPPACPPAHPWVVRPPRETRSFVHGGVYAYIRYFCVYYSARSFWKPGGKENKNKTAGSLCRNVTVWPIHVPRRVRASSAMSRKATAVFVYV